MSEVKDVNILEEQDLGTSVVADTAGSTKEVDTVMPSSEERQAASISALPGHLKNTVQSLSLNVDGMGQVEPSGECTSCQDGAHLAYVLGQLDFDFGTEARQDSISQDMGGNPNNPEQLLEFLDANPFYASSITWTLNVDGTPVYAIQPGGAFPQVVYERLREMLKDQLSGNVERISIPGVVVSSVTLMSGQNVPLLVPDVRGMYSWSTQALVKAVCGEPPKKENAEYNNKRLALANFLERIYYELRNLGTTSEARAMNYAATNAFQVGAVFTNAASEGMELDSISVEPSPVCRLGSDCLDVKLVFFDPIKRQERARKVHRFTIDVSDVVPVTVGAPRSWSVY